MVDEWLRGGLTDAVIAPGSRSTPLVLALAARTELRLHVFHDERSASFAALGLGLATGRAAVLVCTSGTAAAEFHAAVVEAHQGEVPLLVCTADRPPELRDVAAAQAIDQQHLFGRAVRWFCDPGVPDDAMAGSWRSLAARALADTKGARPGPVHLNLPFREPLLAEPGPLPEPRDSGPWHRDVIAPGVPTEQSVEELSALMAGRRGVIVAGAGAGDADVVHGLATALGWPVLADPRSGCRSARPTTVAAFDSLLRHRPFADQQRPEVVLRLGEAPASKVLAQWLAASGALQIAVHRSDRWIDPDHNAAVRVVSDPDALCRQLTGLASAAPERCLAQWQRGEQVAQEVLDTAEPHTEPGLARWLTANLPAGSTLVVSSSMPVRDVEWYGAPRDDLRVLANRGANGIDGVTSTAVGVALSGAPTTLLIGDVAFLHDTNALIALAQRGVDLTIVVIDNDGGGIFEFLAPAAALPRQRFERLFGTPHGTDIEALAAAHRVAVVDVADALVPRGVRLARVVTNRQANVVVHDQLHQAVAAALTADA
ncbi:MAG: 2-succinyl-5-enolpyruvyl-6-hydroxy-3-cyclohexene-carboxylate synthase [Acidimicrobiia bacterium]|nr:2-succinyl-5-enolpyruvyl-6-hydroxy-3-cyclohexene-carboxylate synthase [Acidimicrobiia bacterium]